MSSFGGTGGSGRLSLFADLVVEAFGESVPHKVQYTPIQFIYTLKHKVLRRCIGLHAGKVAFSMLVETVL